MKPRVLWNRSGTRGVVCVLGVDGETANKVLSGATEKMCNSWLVHDVEGGRIVVRQPAQDRCLGGAAEREHVDDLVRWARDMVKAELKRP